MTALQDGETCPESAVTALPGQKSSPRIVFTLSVLNLERAVFEIMAGNSSNPGTSADDAYAF